MSVTISSLNSVETTTDDNENYFCSSRIFSLNDLFSNLEFWKVNFIRCVEFFDKGFFGFAGIRLISSSFFTTFFSCEDF